MSAASCRASVDLVRAYLAAAGRITSGDLAQIAGLTGQGALGVLSRLEAEHVVARGPSARGRSAPLHRRLMSLLTGLAHIAAACRRAGRETAGVHLRDRVPS